MKQTSVDHIIRTSHKPVLAYFWSPWCPDCKQFASIFANLIHDYQGRVQVLKIKIEDNIALAEKYTVMSTPSVVLFINGREVTRIVEQYNKGHIKNKLDRALYPEGGHSYDPR